MLENNFFYLKFIDVKKEKTERDRLKICRKGEGAKNLGFCLVYKAVRVKRVNLCCAFFDGIFEYLETVSSRESFISF